MSGRRRRASTSSVETVDDGQIRWLQEASVVRSVPSDLPSDSWPTFELRDAIVLDREGKALENALHVSTRGPFIVRGQLIIDDASQKSHLIMRFRASLPIEIRHCITYAIGETEGDRRPLIWITGRGGWYEISPSDAYLPIFNKMCEATSMYYNIIDIYASKRLKRSHKKSTKSSRLDALSDVFLQYATRIGDGSTFDEVVERCTEHASFFVSQFAQEDFGVIDWKRTGFYKWFMAKHADVAEKYEESIKNPRQVPRTPSVELVSPIPEGKPPGPVTRSASVEEIHPSQALSSQKLTKAGSTSRRIKASPSAVSQSPAISAIPTMPTIPTQPAETTADSSDGDDSAFASLLAAFEHVYKKSGESKQGLTVSKTLNDLYFDYKFPTYRDGTVGSHKTPVTEVLHYNASALLRTLDKEKYQKHEIYSFLQDLAQKQFSPVAFQPSKFPYQLVARKPNPPRQFKKLDAVQPPPVVESISSQADDGDVETDNPPPPSPPPPRHAGKTMKKPGRRPGKTSGLRTVTSSMKRPHSELESESESESEASGFKRSHYFSDGDGDAAMKNAAEAGPGQPAEPIKIVIRTEKIPSTVPRGPDNTWTCDQQDCDYIVRGGDAEECQAQIRQHFDKHERQTKRLDLAVTESSRGHVPINHLLEKLKRLGEQAQPSQQLSVGGEPPLQPIKRKLIV